MKNKKSHKVRIDGEENTLTLVMTPSKYQSGYQYNTEGNRSAHTFPRRIHQGEKFRTNGHRYEILT